MEHRYGQSFLCMSLSLDALNDVGEQLWRDEHDVSSAAGDV